jgi:hypothetical protein
MKRSILWLPLLSFVCFGQTGNPPKKENANVAFEKITVCQLEQDPAAYNQKQIELTAFASHGFEDSSIFELGCGETYNSIWMEYGGTASTATIYCCGETAKPSRKSVLKVEGITLPLVNGENFKTFNTLLHQDGGRIVRATFRGTFFSGERITYPSGKSGWSGYGHMGCCSLFIIQDVAAVFPQNIEGLDYGSSVDQPGTKFSEGCRSMEDFGSDGWKTLVEMQHKADNGTDIWRYDKPEQIASEGLAKIVKTRPERIKLEETKKTANRIVYYWRPHGHGGVRYMVVVNRPYQLSFQAKDPAKTIWVVAGMYSVCD